MTSLSPFSIDFLETSKKFSEIMADGNAVIFRNKGSGLLAKIIPGDIELSETYARNEFDIGNKLYNLGVNVPKRHDLVYVTKPLVIEGYREFSNFWLIIMEDLGYYFTAEEQNLSFDDLQSARRQYLDLLLDCLDLGFLPSEYDFGENCNNSIYNSILKKTYLIDFEDWVETRDNNIQIFREKILSNYNQILLAPKNLSGIISLDGINFSENII